MSSRPSPLKSPVPAIVPAVTGIGVAPFVDEAAVGLAEPVGQHAPLSFATDVAAAVAVEVVGGVTIA